MFDIIGRLFNLYINFWLIIIGFIYFTQLSWAEIGAACVVVGIGWYFFDKSISASDGLEGLSEEDRIDKAIKELRGPSPYVLTASSFDHRKKRNR
jgi:hypothetical protein